MDAEDLYELNSVEYNPEEQFALYDLRSFLLDILPKHKCQMGDPYHGDSQIITQPAILGIDEKVLKYDLVSYKKYVKGNSSICIGLIKLTLNTGEQILLLCDVMKNYAIRISDNLDESIQTLLDYAGLDITLPFRVIHYDLSK